MTSSETQHNDPDGNSWQHVTTLLCQSQINIKWNLSFLFLLRLCFISINLNLDNTDNSKVSKHFHKSESCFFIWLRVRNKAKIELRPVLKQRKQCRSDSENESPEKEKRSPLRASIGRNIPRCPFKSIQWCDVNMLANMTPPPSPPDVRGG